MNVNITKLLNSLKFKCDVSIYGSTIGNWKLFTVDYIEFNDHSKFLTPIYQSLAL